MGARLNSGFQLGTGRGRGAVLPEPGAVGGGERWTVSGMLLPHRPRCRYQGWGTGHIPHLHRPQWGVAGSLGQLLLSQKRKPGAQESPFVPLDGRFCFSPPACGQRAQLCLAPGHLPRGPSRWDRTPPSLHPMGTSTIPPCPRTLRLGQDNDVAGQTDVAGCPALQWNGITMEVVQHLHDGGEAEVLDTALAPLCQRQPQVLWGGARTCYPSTGSLAGGDDEGTRGYLGWGTNGLSMMCCIPGPRCPACCRGFVPQERG